MRERDRRSVFPKINAWASDESTADIAIFTHIILAWAWSQPDEWRNDPDMRDLKRRLAAGGVEMLI